MIRLCCDYTMKRLTEQNITFRFPDPYYATIWAITSNQGLFHIIRSVFVIFVIVKTLQLLLQLRYIKLAQLLSHPFYLARLFPK